MGNRLAKKRVLVSQAGDFMGPITTEFFRSEGAEMITSTQDLTSAQECQDLVDSAGDIDVLVANLAGPTNTGIQVTELSNEQWGSGFRYMVDPLHWLTQAVLPQMIERKKGKIVVYGSAAGLKGMKTVAAYSAARAAQIGYVRAVGVEVAPHNIQINLIAQNYVENPDYYPPELMQKESFAKSLRRQVPAGRLGTPEEDAAFALFLASDESGFFCGQAFPFTGGWLQ